MAKSSYLDNLINGKLPIIPRSTYINKLWRNTTDNVVVPPTSSIFNNLTNNTDYILMGSDYLNNLNNTIKNQLVTDMSHNYTSKVTLDDKYLPTVLKGTSSDVTGKYKNKITAPPDYLPATITRISGDEKYEIPVLFPKSFSRSIQASFAKENPVGSTRPIVAYSFTNAEQIPLEFDALSDYLPSPYKTLNEYVEAIIKLLKPKITSSVIYEPTVAVTFADISFQGICESISVNYDSVYDYKSFTHAVISCQFTKLS